ncbi:MAG TPA: glycosyltransferase N-terminal domain-containing protein, partial [Bacteroidales bacterium]|nr:glycosyltransferase N-terminal domain-containing protein [Bacteroidales bacterium]
MNRFYLFCYDLLIYIYGAAIRIVALFRPKAKLWVAGRKKIFKEIEEAVSIDKDAPVAWFHCASLGEFEQGRPVMEAFRKDHPGFRILVTFFSPSGYEIRKDYPGADFIFYLPADTPKNAKRFLDLVRPEIAFFVKYEFWFNYLRELADRNIPVYSISAAFREDQYLFRWYGKWALSQLRQFTAFFV